MFLPFNPITPESDSNVSLKTTLLATFVLLYFEALLSHISQNQRPSIPSSFPLRNKAREGGRPLRTI